MLERFKRNRPPDETGAVATVDRPDGTTATPGEPALEEDRGIRRESTTPGDRTVVDERPRRHFGRTGNGAPAGLATPSALDVARRRQRDEFGGVNWGASFFGWLVAVGVAALLTALLAAAGAALDLTDDAGARADDELSLGGGIALVAVLVIAYYAGGYVAGRMSRFDGGRQGLGSWLIGVLVTVALAAAALIFGDEYNVLDKLNLPSLPVGDETLATGAIVAIAAIAVGSALAAMLGGKVGERYHRRIDRAGFVD
jgi:hypothetical protein